MKTWKQLKNQLLAMQKNLEEVNGVEYCKNCGINFNDLISDLEEFLTPSSRLSAERGRKEEYGTTRI